MTEDEANDLRRDILDASLQGAHRMREKRREDELRTRIAELEKELERLRAANFHGIYTVCATHPNEYAIGKHDSVCRECLVTRLATLEAENERLRSFERGWREIEAMYGRTEEERKREDLTHYLRRQKDMLTMKRVEVDKLKDEKKRLRASLDASPDDERIYTRHVFEMDCEIESERHRLQVLIADRDVLRNEHTRLKLAVAPESDPESLTDFVTIAEISREQAAAQEATAFENSQLTAKAHESVKLREENERLRAAALRLLPSAYDIECIRNEPADCFSAGLVALYDALAGKEEADA